MDDTIALSSRSAAMEALSNLNASHTRMASLAAALVDRLFPGDGLTRDEMILPFANLAFIAVTKARADLDTYSKSFSEVLKTIDTMRGTTSGSAPEAGSSASPSNTSDSIVQSESVVALKRKYEEGMAATATPPKKGPPSPRGGNTSSPALSVSGPKKTGFGAKNSGAAAAPVSSPPKGPAPIAPTASGANVATTTATTTNQPAAVIASQPAPAAAPAVAVTAPEPEPAQPEPVIERPVTPEVTLTPAKDEKADTLSNSEASTSEAPRSVTDSPSTAKQLDPSKKEAMKKALEDMVLPARKKASPPPPKPAASPAADSPAVESKKGESRKELKEKSKSDVSTSASVNAGVTSTSSPDASSAAAVEDNSVSQSEDSARNKLNSHSDTNTAGTSDDDVSSDEEEYLRGVEERRQRAAAEKADRAKAAKEAREARQNMYSFLNNDPPPGFVTPKQTASTSATGKSKTKKEKKDKPKDKTSSKTMLTGNTASSLNGAANNGSHEDEVSGRKKASGANVSASGGNGVEISGLALGSRASSELDLSSSPVPHDNPLSSSQSTHANDGSFTTRYRPVSAIDPSTWKRAEEAILKDATVSKPPRRRWEEYQAKFTAKREAAEAAADAAAASDHKAKDTPKKQYSTTNLKAGLKSNLQLKGLRSNRERRPSHADVFAPAVTDSPGRRRTVTHSDDFGSGGGDSPRRKSNADDSSDSKDNGSSPSTPIRTSGGSESPNLGRKPLPKLERVDDPRVFLFEAPIAENNFRFMERNGEELIAGGTIEKLIQILTSSSESNPEYFQCFMLTYHNFLTPQKLINLLRLRWNSQPSDPTKMDLFISKHLHSIRLRIVNVLRMWIEKFGTDFKDESVVEALNEFVEYIRLEYPQMADLVSSKLNKYLAGYIFDTEGDVDEEPPETFPVADGKEANPSLTDIHPEEFARQMALVEHALFKAIPYKELLTNASAGKQNPNVSNMISYTNHLVNWIGTQIVKPDDIKVRAVALSRFITIAKYCIISCQNYNGAMEILSALRSAPVFRLKHTWNRLTDNIWDDYEWLENIFESDNNYAIYRAALLNAVPPCVPYLGRYLSEILFLNELHPDYLDGTASGPSPIINFAKMTYVADILLHLQRYQKSPFCLTGAPAIQKFFLLKRGVMGDKDLYKLSLEREPREPSGSLSSVTSD